MIKLKNKKEIEKIRLSGKILAETFEIIRENLKSGITTKELDNIAYNYIVKCKAKPAFKGYMGYPASICISVNDEVIHGIPSKRIIEEGDIVSLDLGVNFEGFISDSAITLPVGKIGKEVQLLLKTTQECLTNGISMAVTGNRVSDISKAIFIHAKKHNYGIVRDFCGHGVGFNVHEEPQIPNYINNGPNPRLKTGMVIAIEPMINIGGDEVIVMDDKWTVKTADKSLSAHFEHTVAVFEERAEILTLL
ncbi:MAG: type I methionyl aminopeptidase [Spirochaetia bacterium]|jgi:methionyl aminopeptidase|nr:type I methionyl aminopeptidase [Spirochaetia bacterium]